MKQVFQDLKTGECTVEEVPTPSCPRGGVLVRSRRSLISAGTERSLVDFGRAGYLEKMMQQPDRVREVLEKVSGEGLFSTVEAVRSRLARPVPMGYSNVGEVVAVGSGVSELKQGDRVVSNGTHAEFVAVPKNLCARIPDGVSDDVAAFAIVGAVGLQSLRLAVPTLGETFVVVGLGLIGLLTVELLRANGCRVIGVDLKPDRLRFAASVGVEVIRRDLGRNAADEVLRLTDGIGADGVIVTATARSSEVMHEAAQMSRKRGRVVLVGVVGLDLRRSDFYEKELTFQVSCSYGPGRYDPVYEEQGHDYPLPFVRWTEKRNIEAVLELMNGSGFPFLDLVSGRYPVTDAGAAYRQLVEDDDAIGLLLEYPWEAEVVSARDRVVHLRKPVREAGAGTGVVLGAIGAGNYAGRVLLPAFKKAGSRLKTVVSAGGRSSTHVGRKLGFEMSATDLSAVFGDPEINTVVVATRHDTHADLVAKALASEKDVFVEKPLALTLGQLDQIREAHVAASARGAPRRVMVGFNRRFAPLVRSLKLNLSRSERPISLIYLCNAGAVPLGSWVHDPGVGGGRILGEACHFIDLARFLAGASIEAGSVDVMEDVGGLGDTANISLRFANGSIAAVHYFANGNPRSAKERIEVTQAGRTFVLDDFRTLKGRGFRPWPDLRRRDKGRGRCVEAFVESIRSGLPSPIPFEELIEVSRMAIRLGRSEDS